jgi:Holliday junction resolvase RusA-like endonuclease
MSVREVIELLDDSDVEDVAVAMVNVGVNGGVTVTVTGKPQAMPRPVFMSWLRNSTLHRRVTNKKTKHVMAFRQLFLEAIRQQNVPGVDHLPLFKHEPVVLEVQFYRRIPSSAFRGGDRSRPFVGGRYNDRTNHPDVMRPDIDNLLKFVMDSLNGVLYNDDEQVVKLISYKMLDVEPPYEGRTVITFKELNRAGDFPRRP